MQTMIILDWFCVAEKYVRRASPSSQKKSMMHVRTSAPCQYSCSPFPPPLSHPAHLVMIPIDGCSINPARSFATAVTNNEWADQW